MEQHEAPVTALATGANDNQVVIGDAFGMVVNWRPEIDSQVHGFAGMTGEVTQMRFLGSDTAVIAADARGQVARLELT